MDFPGGSVVKNPPANAGATGDGGSIIESGRSCRGVNGNPLQYSWTEKPGQRSLADYSLRDHKELDTTEHIHTRTHKHLVGRMGSISEGESGPKYGMASFYGLGNFIG